MTPTTPTTPTLHAGAWLLAQGPGPVGGRPVSPPSAGPEAVSDPLAGEAQPAPYTAYRPFIDPLPAHDLWWAMLLPIALFVSMVYKAVRVRSMDTYWRQVGAMTVQTVVGMVMLALGVYLFVEWLAPRLLAPA